MYLTPVLPYIPNFTASNYSMQMTSPTLPPRTLAHAPAIGMTADRHHYNLRNLHWFVGLVACGVPG
jgi:hypothetical protein